MVQILYNFNRNLTQQGGCIYEEIKMKKNVKNILKRAKDAVDSYGGWFWHEELTGIEELEQKIEKNVWCNEPDFEYLSLEILKYLEIINEYGQVDTETVQFRADIWSDEKEFRHYGKNEQFDDFYDYLEYQKEIVFEDLQLALIDELTIINSEIFKEEKK